VGCCGYKGRPLLVEGNLEWGVEGLQRGHGGPLGETRFPESYMSHVKTPEIFQVIAEARYPGSENDG